MPSADAVRTRRSKSVTEEKLPDWARTLTPRGLRLFTRAYKSRSQDAGLGSRNPVSPLWPCLLLHEFVISCNNQSMRGRRQRSSRVFTISFPQDLAKQVDKVAREESRNFSELFREAFRTYRMERVRRRLQADLAYARTRNPKGYREDDVEPLVDEVRAKTYAKKDGR